MNAFKKRIALSDYPKLSIYLLKWLALAIVSGIFVGSASALLLVSLFKATDYREANPWIIWLLPIGGLIIGLLYHYYGKSVVKGNNQLIDELHSPKDIVPFKMAPLVYIGTVITHLFGGSAGREGTAVQMGGAIVDQLSKILKFGKNDRKILMVMGISAGFASVFGTPLAGAIFALEVLVIGRMRYDAILPSFLAAVIADYICNLWGVPHTHYHINFVPEMGVLAFFIAIVSGIIFGVVSTYFSKGIHWFQNIASKIKYPPLRPFIGGIIIALCIFLLGTTKYIGLGIPTIVEAFETPLPYYDFAIKILLTTFTIGVGFKGGEVTPLFFIGATLGNALALFLPLPMALLAGMGFVAVFSGATNTPIACTIMGIELFGMEAGVFIAIACVTAYLFSGNTGIYSSQIIGSAKSDTLQNTEGKSLSEF
ncbi:voltage-gated chloride channel family protein [Flavicella sediminum]|uniref:voltage-gated chloride channel family protein n=1 Tax=Flavicella sediminum TaxID=2585141 RepID=UPI00111CF322|nr:voltage-gated chloride channel family protein [Flavicella sediminum]